MLNRALLIPIAAVGLALAGAYAFSIASRGGDMLLVQALHGSSAPVRAAAALGLRRFARCPDRDFVPSTAIGMLIAAWDRELPASRVRDLLAQLQALGCDINARGEHGLAPLHSAILFNNVNAVHLLLQAGADPAVRTRLDRSDGRSGEYDAPTFTRRLADAGEDDYGAILALFAATGEPGSAPPPAGQP